VTVQNLDPRQLWGGRRLAVADTVPAGILAQASTRLPLGVRAETKTEPHRLLDVLGAAVLLLLTLPVLLLVAVAIRLESPGPILYRQERIGRAGRTFTILKLRSMRDDAEADGVARWAAPKDSRVTRVGRFIRLTRIDEIPQALNVLRGEMALVGPRPERTVFVEQLDALIPHYHDRHAVLPGITGWAQVSMPYGASVDDAEAKLAYDLDYIRRRSLRMDLAILAATVRVMVFRIGAR